MIDVPDPEPDSVDQIVNRLERIEDDLSEHGLTEYRERLTELRIDLADEQLDELLDGSD